MFTVIRAVATVVLSIKVVVHSLGPKEWLVHHPVSLRTVQLCNRSVYILVAVRVIQRTVGHFTIKVRYSHILTGHVYVSRRGLFGNLCQYPVSLFQDSRYMAARNVGGSCFVARSVVKVTDVCIVRHCIVELNHRKDGLSQVQFVKHHFQTGVYTFLHVAGQTVYAN